MLIPPRGDKSQFVSPVGLTAPPATLDSGLDDGQSPAVSFGEREPDDVPELGEDDSRINRSAPFTETCSTTTLFHHPSKCGYWSLKNRRSHSNNSQRFPEP